MFDRGTTRRNPVRGFTLLEALIASAVLAIIVLAVGAAVVSAQRITLEGRNMVLAAMAADDLLSELSATPYAGLDAHDGLVQPTGGMTSLSGNGYPVTYGMLGRSIVVDDAEFEDAETGIKIRGKRVAVACFDDVRVIVELETFVPEPAS